MPGARGQRHLIWPHCDGLNWPHLCVGQGDEHDPAVVGVAFALDPPALLEALDEQRHRRLGQALELCELGDTPRRIGQRPGHPGFGARHIGPNLPDEQARIATALSVIIGSASGGVAGAVMQSFTDLADGHIGTMALVPQVVDAVSAPVIAAGGIADGRGIVAALSLGAAGVQMGTAFLGCPETQMDPLYRRTLFEPRAARTRVTTVLTGRPARAIATRFIEEMADQEGQTPAFPLQRAMVAPLARAAAAADSPEFLAMYAGQAAPLTRRLPAAQLFAALVRETETALRR